MRIFAIVSLLLITASIGSAQTLGKIEDEILGHMAKLEKASNYGSSSNYDVLAKENQAVRAALLKYGGRSDVLTASFVKLKKRFTITTSRDGKFRTYSWDSGEGGTQHDFGTVYQFGGKSGKAHAWTAPYTQSMENRGAGEFVQQIFQTDTATGPIYLAVSTLIGSTSLNGQTISALKIEGETLDRNPKVIKTTSGIRSSINFQYDFFSVVDHPERPVKLFFYDEARKSFRFPVVIADKKTPQGRVTNRFITYRFDGKYFERAK